MAGGSNGLHDIPTPPHRHSEIRFSLALTGRR